MTDTDWASLISWLGRNDMVLCVPARGAPTLLRVRKSPKNVEESKERFAHALRVLYKQNKKD